MAELNKTIIKETINHMSRNCGYPDLKPSTLHFTFVMEETFLPIGYGKSLCYMLLPKLFDSLYEQPVGSNMQWRSHARAHPGTCPGLGLNLEIIIILIINFKLSICQ